MKFEYFKKNNILNSDILGNISDDCEGIFLVYFDKAPYWIEVIKNPNLCFFVPDGHIGFSTTDYQQAIEQLKIVIIENNNDVEDWSDEDNFQFIPTHIQDILDKSEEGSYEICRVISDELNKVGWECDYDLSASVFGVIPMTKEAIETYKDKQLEKSYISGELEKIGFCSTVTFSIKLRNPDGMQTKWISLTGEAMELINNAFKK
jgi:hypothetical protein